MDVCDHDTTLDFEAFDEDEIRAGAPPRDGDLPVIGGHRHRDDRPGMEIGPVMHTLLYHAERRVAVVPIG